MPFSFPRLNIKSSENWFLSVLIQEKCSSSNYSDPSLLSGTLILASITTASLDFLST